MKIFVCSCDKDDDLFEPFHHCIEKYYPNLKINYILSNEENFKITTPLDYEIAKIIVEKKIW